MSRLVPNIEAARSRLEREKQETIKRTQLSVARVAARAYLWSQDIVPEKSGALKRSGKISEVMNVGSKFQVTITYGDDSVQYAAAVHEDPDARHSSNKQYKYLEMPLRDAASVAIQDVESEFSK